MRRCFEVRYSTEAMETASAVGLTVTVVNSGAEDTPPDVATTENWSVTPGAPTGRVTVNPTVAEFAFGASTIPAGAVHAKVHGARATQEAVSETGTPEATVTGKMWLTVGAAGALTVTDVV